MNSRSSSKSSLLALCPVLMAALFIGCSSPLDSTTLPQEELADGSGPAKAAGSPSLGDAARPTQPVSAPSGAPSSGPSDAGDALSDVAIRALPMRGAIPEADGSSNTGDGAAAGPPGRAGWTLTWNDEFDRANGSDIDLSKWSHVISGDGNGNQEREYYTDGTANGYINAGSLVLKGTKEGADKYQCWYGQCWYTSGKVQTLGKFSQKYGRFEARIKIPFSKGLWPAFWI